MMYELLYFSCLMLSTDCFSRNTDFNAFSGLVHWLIMKRMRIISHDLLTVAMKQTV